LCFFLNEPMEKFFSNLSISILKLVSHLPLRIHYFIADIIYLLVWYVIGYRKKVVLTNLRNSFPEKTEKEITAIAKKYFRHLGDIIVETIKLSSIKIGDLRKMVVFKNPEILQQMYEKGKDVILISGHYGNWEMIQDTPSYSKHKYSVIYKPLTNKPFDEFFKKIRTRFGVNVLPMNEAYRSIVSDRRQGIRTVTYFVADQSPVETKYWTIFLNQETPVFIGPERIARKLKTAVIFTDIMKRRRGLYEVIFTPICEDASLTKENEITNAHVRLLEKTIRENPEYWLWSHRRWKRKRPEGIELTC